MDSTTPDPQPQPTQQPQPQQLQQQQHKQQPQSQQPKPQPPQQHQPPHQHHQQQHHHPHPHPHSHQHHHLAQPTQPSYSQLPFSPYYPPRGPYPAQYQHYPPSYTYGYPAPPAWPPAPGFPSAQAQQLSNMVNPQPQSNVPQQHNKQSPQTMNYTNADRTHNPTLAAGRVTNPPVRAVVRATLKDPETKEEIPLPDKPSTTKSSSSISNESPNAVTATAPTKSVVTLLQKVSEPTNNSEATSNKQEETEKPAIVKSAVDGNNKSNSEATPSVKTAIRATLTTTTSSTPASIPTSTPTTKPTTVTTNATKTTPIVPQNANKNDKKPAIEVPNHQDKLKDDPVPRIIAQVESQPDQTSLQKVSENNLEESKTKENGQEFNDQETETLQSKEENVNEILEILDSPDEASIPKEGKVNRNEENGEDSNKEDINSDSSGVLNYAPGQYNPISNRNGKKVYDKKFLIDVLEKVCKPGLTLLQNNDMDDYGGNRQLSTFSDKQVDPFAPPFSTINQKYPLNRQNEPARRQSQNNYAGRSSGGQERQRKVITSVSLTQDVELKTSSNPWRPAKEIKEDAPIDVAETETLKKKFRSILNKLTPNNFENLSKAVTDLHIDTESKLGEVIDIVFAKALAEPGYCVLYGRMCSHLQKITAGQANFGNTLLKRCQQQFQADIYSGCNVEEREENINNEEDPEIKKQLTEELYEEKYRCRVRSLGLIKFIGELYKINMLNNAIMFDCISRLLMDPAEESLECLCDLLVTIGEKIDQSSKNNSDIQKKPKGSQKSASAYQNPSKTLSAIVAGSNSQQKAAVEDGTIKITNLDQVFDRLHSIRKNKDLPLSVRIRFKLLDTCELREKENWMSKKTKDNNPKKLEEIREAHKEKLEEEKRQLNAMGPRRSQEGRRLGHSGGSSSQISSLANESSSSHLNRDYPSGDNTKSNHNDMEEHNKKKSNLPNFNTLTSPASFSLRPTYGKPLERN